MDTKNKELKNDFLYGYIKLLREFILQEGYPCIGARTATNSRSLTVGVFKEMKDPETPGELAYGLLEYLISLQSKPSNYLTYVAIFPFDSFDGEEGFENALWRLINELHILDREHFDWSPEISSDPGKRDFSFSFLLPIVPIGTGKVDNQLKFNVQFFGEYNTSIFEKGCVPELLKGKDRKDFRDQMEGSQRKRAI